MVEARRALGRLELEGLPRIGQRAISGPGDHQLVEAVRTDIKAAAALRAAQPFLAGGRIEGAVQCGDIDGNRSQRLRCVEQHWHAGGGERLRVRHRPADIRDVRARDQPRLL